MNPKAATPYRHRLVAVALAAAWVGAFAATSPPATGPQAMPKSDPSGCRVVLDPVHPGWGDYVCP